MTLENAFRNTIYRVYLSRGHIDLRVGDETSARRLHARLSPRAHADAWIITAHNPGGNRAAPWRNARRHRELIALLNRQAAPWLPALNIDPAGEWPDEPGVCVWNLGERGARALGHRFGQAALLNLPNRGTPKLTWL